MATLETYRKYIQELLIEHSKLVWDDRIKAETIFDTKLKLILNRRDAEDTERREEREKFSRFSFPGSTWERGFGGSTSIAARSQSTGF